MVNEVQPVYTAAGTGRRLQIYRAYSTGPNAAIAAAGTLVSRSREAVRNDPWAATLLNRSTSNGVGTGIQCKQTWGEEAFRAQVKDLWDLSCGLDQWDANGVLDFYGFQELAWREWKEAGEVFVRIRPRYASDPLYVPVQFELLESEQCPRELNRTLENGNRIVQGVELNRLNRRVAYWFYPTHPGDATTLGSYTSNEPVRVRADKIVHLFRVHRAGAMRGVPLLSTALPDLLDMRALRSSVLERQKIANLFAGWYRRPAGEPEQKVGVLEENKTGYDSDGTPLAGMEPGTMQELPPGYEVDFNEPPGPGTEFAEFMRGSLMAISSTTGIPYEIVSGDLRNVSDRALRLGLLEFRRSVEVDQYGFFIPQFLQRLREAWFDAAVLAGKLVVDGYEDPATRAKVNKVRWFPHGWSYSHPVQDVQSELLAIAGGLTSRTDTVGDNGGDSEEIDRQQAEDNARADRLKLLYTSDGRTKAALKTPESSSDPTKSQSEGNT